MSNINLAIQRLAETTHPHLVGVNVAPDLSSYQSMVDTWRDPSLPVPTEVEVSAALVAVEAEWAAQVKIERLENQMTLRRIREMTTPEGQQWMADLEAQIAIERAKL